MTNIDPAAIMDPVRGYLPDTLVYRLAKALAASEAKVARVEDFAARLVADGYSTCIYESAAEMGEIIRATLADPVTVCPTQ